MARAQLATSIREFLMSAAESFKADGKDDGSEFNDILDVAAADLSRFRPRTLVDSVTLVADQSAYAAPADIIYTIKPLWGADRRRSRKRWERSYPGVLPKLSLISSGLFISPSPTAEQIANLSSKYSFFYAARHTIGDTSALTTVPTSDRHLLILRAMVEALKWLSINNMNKPIRLRDGFSQGAKNGTPSALSERLMMEFEAQAK